MCKIYSIDAIGQCKYLFSNPNLMQALVSRSNSTLQLSDLFYNKSENTYILWYILNL